ncbi:MAG: NnrU family protein [Hyphomicrobiales bacterium]
MIAFLGGLLVFLGIHSVRIFAPNVRSRLIAGFGGGQKGETLWKVAYSIIALLSLIWLVSGYNAAKSALGFVWLPPTWMAHITLLLMLPALILLVAAYIPSKIKALARHPMLLSVKIWAFAHLLANGMGVHLMLFGGFLIWAVLDRISVKKRGEPDPVAPKGWVGDVIAVLLGTGAWVVLLLWGHQWLFGVAPIG